MWNRGTTTAIAILLIMLVSFVVLVFGPQYELSLFPNQNAFEKDIPQLTNEYRRTWATAIAGLVLIIGLYFTWRTVHATQEGQRTERQH